MPRNTPDPRPVVDQSSTDLRRDLEKVDISTLVIHGDDHRIVSIVTDHLRSD